MNLNTHLLTAAEEEEEPSSASFCTAVVPFTPRLRSSESTSLIAATASPTLLPSTGRELTTYQHHSSTELSDGSKFVGPLLYETASMSCPLCRRPFQDRATSHAAVGALPMVPSNNSDGGGGSGGAPDHGEGGGRSTAVRQVLTPWYFRSLPPKPAADDEYALRDDEGEDNYVALLGDVEHSAAAISSPCSPTTFSETASSTNNNNNALSQQQQALDQEDAAMMEKISSGYYKVHFQEVKKLGGGTFGAVFLCRHVLEDVSLGLFAVKKIPIGSDPSYVRKVLREVRVLEEVKRHPNVVEYNHSWIDFAKLADFGPAVRCMFILMEYATDGSLDQYCEGNGFSLTNEAVWYFFLSAVAGVAHLHSKSILHRDLKPQNLMLTRMEGKPPRLFVADFGTATLLSEMVSLQDRTGATGTQEYMAPELFDVDPLSTKTVFVHSHTKASDVWSLGMILHYLMCDGALPAILDDGTALLTVDSHSPYRRPAEMIELTKAMLRQDPAARPSCSDILHSGVTQRILKSFERTDASAMAAWSATTTTSQRPSEHDGGAAPLLLTERRASSLGVTPRRQSGTPTIKRVDTLPQGGGGGRSPPPPSTPSSFTKDAECQTLLTGELLDQLMSHVANRNA